MRQSLVGPNIRIGSEAIKNWLLLQESAQKADALCHRWWSIRL